MGEDFSATETFSFSDELPVATSSFEEDFFAETFSFSDIVVRKKIIDKASIPYHGTGVKQLFYNCSSVASAGSASDKRSTSSPSAAMTTEVPDASGPESIAKLSA
ncbi:MAG TPA: hypothetical protein ENJ77_01435 [Candidatus Moranbacteria bacterium]|nr:hypothetical protein [Candidatus Moranbacteria bacterium]